MIKIDIFKIIMICKNHNDLAPLSKSFKFRNKINDIAYNYYHYF